jgi:serine-type D-Ala-D-Ala carboxypeptidase (penicillin-binding protein 5/6)
MFVARAEARRHTPVRKAVAPASNPTAHEPNPPAAPYAAACAMEPSTGTVIFEHDMNRPWPTASLAKMMVMLIVAKKITDGSLKLTDKVTTSAAAARMGGSQVYLKEGETFTLEEMMQAVVIHSANDATYAVAEYIAGSADACVQMMNQEATTLGLRNTHYYTVHGLPPAAGEQADVASAYDLAVIAQKLVAYPDILRWSAIDTTGFRNGSFQLRNTNHLVRTYPGCDGLKTGFYYQAGFNVVATARRNGLRVIAVVLGSPRKEENFGAAATMMSQGFLNYEMHAVAKKGTPIDRTVAVKGGAIGAIRPVWGADAAVLIKRDEPKNSFTINYELPASITAPVTAGQAIGAAAIVVQGKPQQSIPILAPVAVARGSLLQRLIGDLWFAPALCPPRSRAAQLSDVAKANRNPDRRRTRTPDRDQPRTPFRADLSRPAALRRQPRIPAGQAVHSRRGLRDHARGDRRSRIT